MPLQDLPIAQLRTTNPLTESPADFGEFWDATLDEARRTDAEPVFTPVPLPFADIGVWDVSFPGFAGHPIRGWLLAPREQERRRTGMVWFPGYGGGRGEPHEWLPWAAAGVSLLVMDVRGQGADWGGAGSTPDPVGSAPATSGFMTRGIGHPQAYYYRRVITDCVRAVDALRTFPGVDPRAVIAAGGSQGGGLALAVSGLVPDLLGVIADVPFLCDFPRAVRTYETGPYGEIARYLGVQRAQTQAFDTLAYVDGVNFARRATAPLLASVALLDGICPPATVFAAYNAYAAEKDIDVFEFNGHEGGGAQRWPRQQAFVARLVEVLDSGR